MRVALGVSIVVWTLAAWGGRIGLLASGEGLGAWLRIGGSIAVGLGAAATLLIPQWDAGRKPVLIVFAVFTIVLWLRSLIVTWTGDGSMPFKTVHTVLAVGFFALALWAVAYALSSASGDRSPVAVESQAESGP